MLVETRWTRVCLTEKRWTANIKKKQPLTGCSDAPCPEAQVPLDVWPIVLRPVNAPEKEVDE